MSRFNSCSSIRPFLPLAALGHLLEAEAAKVARHLGACGACQRELEDWRRIAQSFQAAEAAIELPVASLSKTLVALHTRIAALRANSLQIVPGSLRQPIDRQPIDRQPIGGSVSRLLAGESECFGLGLAASGPASSGSDV